MSLFILDRKACYVYRYIRFILFLLPPETAHSFSLFALKCVAFLGFKGKCPQQRKNVFGLHFENPIGIAAGLDKNGDYIDALASLGVGFIEVGAVTPKAQAGNPKPRLFRLQEDEAIINRMGFNNKGVDYLVKRLAARKSTCVIGVNLGKNKATPLAEAKKDYCYSLQKVYAYCDFLTINISSPNTPGLRELQGVDYLQDLLQTVKDARDACYAEHGVRRPLLVKLAPDLSLSELKQILDVINDVGLDGVIANNTSSSRDYHLHSAQAHEVGGLSGKPIAKASYAMTKNIKAYAPTLPLISVGGIDSVKEIQRRIEAGADLVQLYTGLVYKGIKACLYSDD